MLSSRRSFVSDKHACRTFAWLYGCAFAGAVALFGTALSATAQPFPDNACAADRGIANLNCTANDVEIASVQVNNAVTSCVEGELVTLDLTVFLHLNAQDRHDVGMFFARDGKPPVLPAASGGSADCAVFSLPMAPDPFADLDTNACGDFDRDGLPQGIVVAVNIGSITVACVPDQTGHLTVPSVITWDTTGTPTSCQAPPAKWVRPSTMSKCESGIAAQIPVLVHGQITITKQTTPDTSPGSFAFNAAGPGVTPTGFALTDNQTQVLTTGLLGSTAQTYTVSEQLLAGFDPTAQIDCVDIDNDPSPAFVTVNPSTRTVSVRMSADGTQGLTAIFCTFTNIRQGSITVVKNTVGADGSFQFTGSQSFQIATTGHTGQAVLPNLNPGTYTISEIVPAGWDLTNLNCVDPTGDTTTAGSTATVVLAPGESVTCTYTDTARGSIVISKTTSGGDGTFTFGGPGLQSFQITTSGGVGGPHMLPNLLAGTYMVTEVVPGGWDLSGPIVCIDPSGGTTSAGSTATIALAAGEQVSCTFTDTRRASITVEKLTTGGDGTFSFSGSQTFSIITTSGNGQNTSAFASIVPGLAYTITEDSISGWSLSSAACRDASNNMSLGTPVAGGVSVTPVAGQNAICTFEDVKLATLRIFKHAEPHNPQIFGFTATGLMPTPTMFSLTDDGMNPNSMMFPNLPPGSGGAYTVTENAVSGWVLTALTCSDLADPDPTHRSTVTLATRTIDAHLDPGEVLDCTFTNTQIQAGSITITKHAIGGDDTFAFDTMNTLMPASFNITTSGANHTGAQAFLGLAAGSYTIVESPVPTGWDPAPPPINCIVTSGTNTTITQVTNGITIALGMTGTSVDAVACEFTDIKRGSITVAKNASPADPLQLFDFATTSTPSTTPLPLTFQIADSGMQSYGNLVPGTYTITEQQLPSGWRFADINCTGGSVITTDPAARKVTIELQPGEDVSCTYANVKDGTITITKNAVGGTPGETFTFTGTLSGAIANGQSLSNGFSPGTYAISEVVPAGWNLTNIVCTGGSVTITGATVGSTDGFESGDTTVNVTIAAGETATCTFTDTKRGSITVMKNTLGGNGTFDFVGDRSFQIVTAGGTGQNAVAFASVVPGTYAITEVVPTGWQLKGLTCSNQSAIDLNNATATVNVAAGEQVACAFTDARQGTITITKRINADVSTTFLFTVPTSLDPAGSFTLQPPIAARTLSRIFQNVAPGTYTITEGPAPAGWKATAITCTDPTNNTVVNLASQSATVNVAPGESIECVFDNVTLATITISVVSTGDTGTFGFSTNGFGVPTFSLTTPGDGLKASRVFGDILPGTYVVNGLGAKGWSLYQVLCIGDSGETEWSIDGARTTITLPHGENIECIYYYRKSEPEVGSNLFTVPTLDQRLLVLLVACLTFAAVSRIHER